MFNWQIRSIFLLDSRQQNILENNSEALVHFFHWNLVELLSSYEIVYQHYDCSHLRTVQVENIPEQAESQHHLLHQHGEYIQGNFQRFFNQNQIDIRSERIPIRSERNRGQVTERQRLGGEKKKNSFAIWCKEDFQKSDKNRLTILQGEQH